MSDDPFAALEEAVRAVEQTAARMQHLQDTAAALAAPVAAAQVVPPPAEPADSSAHEELMADGREHADEAATTPVEADTDQPDAAARLATLEREREAIRERLARVRDRLAVLSLTVSEPPTQ